MGMTRAFDTRADFSGIDGQRDLFLSAVVQKAFIKVDESGTEAAAATAVVMEASAVIAQAPPKTFKADHPFLYFIRDAAGNVLFMGRVADPSAKG